MKAMTVGKIFFFSFLFSFSFFLSFFISFSYSFSTPHSFSLSPSLISQPHAVNTTCRKEKKYEPPEICLTACVFLFFRQQTSRFTSFRINEKSTLVKQSFWFNIKMTFRCNSTFGHVWRGHFVGSFKTRG